MPNKYNKTKKNRSNKNRSNKNRSNKNRSNKKRNGGGKTTQQKKKSYKVKSQNPVNDYKLSSPEIEDLEYLDRLMEAFDYDSPVKKVKKNVHFGENKVKEITPEGIAQRAPPLPNYKMCKKNTLSEYDFPCTYRNTIFNSLADYNEYKRMLYRRNASTGYKDRDKHYEDVLKNK